MYKRLIQSHAMRRRVSWIIAAVLVLPFLFFFHASSRVFVKGPGGTAGLIFGKPIPWTRFEEQELWIRRPIERQLGGLPASMRPLLIESTWNQLILLEEAKRRRLVVDDRALASYIQQMPAFQDHGAFRPDFYRRSLAAARMSAEYFERNLRNELLIQQLKESVLATAIVSDEEVQAAFLEQHERLQATAILFDPAAFHEPAAAHLTDEELHRYYDAHPDDVRIPEQVTLEYLGTTQEELAGVQRPTEEELSEFYEDHREAFVKDDGSVKTLEEAREQIRQAWIDARVRRQLNALALDLEEDLKAKRALEDIAQSRALSLRTAGPLPVNGPGGPGQPEPAVLQAVAATPAGGLSDVIETGDGVFVARVAARTPARVPPFEEVRERIRQYAVDARTRELAKAAAERCYASLRERIAKGIRFEEAFLTYDTPLTTRPVSLSRTGPIDPLGDAPSINQAAFAAPLGGITDVLDTGRQFVMLRPEARIPADVAQFEAQRQSLREQLLRQRQSERLQSWLTALRARAKLQDYVASSTPSDS